MCAALKPLDTLNIRLRNAQRRWPSRLLRILFARPHSPHFLPLPFLSFIFITTYFPQEWGLESADPACLAAEAFLRFGGVKHTVVNCNNDSMSPNGNYAFLSKLCSLEQSLASLPSRFTCAAHFEPCPMCSAWCVEAAADIRTPPTIFFSSLIPFPSSSPHFFRRIAHRSHSLTRPQASSRSSGCLHRRRPSQLLS